MLNLTYQSAIREPFLGLEQEQEAIRKWQDEGDRSSLELLVRSHIRQAYAQAFKWTNNPTEVDDLVAEGVLGLMRAADKFDREREVRFSTYSHWWVMTSVSTALAKVKMVIDVPSRTYLDARMGRLKSDDQDKVMSAVNGIVNLDAPVRDDDGQRPMDALPSSEKTPEENAVAGSTAGLLRKMIAGAMADLGERERVVVETRKLQASPKTVDELSKVLGITREQVRQVENRAMAQLKQSLVRKGFSPSMLN